MTSPQYIPIPLAEAIQLIELGQPVFFSSSSNPELTQVFKQVHSNPLEKYVTNTGLVTSILYSHWNYYKENPHEL